MRLTTAVAAALLALTGCGGDSTSPTTTTTSTLPARVTSTSTTIGMVLVPNVVGRDLATARATFAAVGFDRLTANDGTQKKRVPGDDWIVDRQSPPAGVRVLTSVYMYLELLKRGERYVNPGTSPCPRLVQC